MYCVWKQIIIWLYQHTIANGFNKPQGRLKWLKSEEWRSPGRHWWGTRPTPGPTSILSSCLTGKSKWARWHLRSPTWRLFTQPFIQAPIKENIKAPRHWPLCGPGRASNAENVSIWWRHHASGVRFANTDMSISPAGANFIKILIKMKNISFEKMYLKTSSAKCQPLCSELNVLSLLMLKLEYFRITRPIPWQPMSPCVARSSIGRVKMQG